MLGKVITLLTVAWIMVAVVPSISSSTINSRHNSDTLSTIEALTQNKDNIRYTNKIKRISPQRLEYNEDDKEDITWMCPPDKVDQPDISFRDIQWFKLSKKTSEVQSVFGTINRATLEIKNPGPADQGRYICVPRNRTLLTPLTMHFYQFIILETKLIDIDSFSNVSVYFNQKISLRCSRGSILKNDLNTNASSMTAIDKYPNTTRDLYKCSNSDKGMIKMPATVSASNCSLSLLGCSVLGKDSNLNRDIRCAYNPRDYEIPRMINSSSERIFLRFYYDRDHECCLPFESNIGDSGNPSFLSLEECQLQCGQVISDFCLTKPLVGECKTQEIKWTFNFQIRKCIRIVDGWCGYSPNVFSTMADCEARCTKFIDRISNVKTTSNTVTFPLHSIIKRMYIQPHIKSNVNDPSRQNLYTTNQWKTERTWNNTTNIPVFNVSIRILEKDPCFGNSLSGTCGYGLSKQNYKLIRYKFVSSFGECHRVEYSGCNGGENLFDDSNDCKSSCEYRLYSSLKSSKCQSPYSVNCVDQSNHRNATHLIRHYYSSSENKCVPFQSIDSKTCLKTFFHSIEECHQLCRPKQASEQLLQNKCFGGIVLDYSSCVVNKRVHRWFYMASIKQCLPYSTCPVSMGGNVFLTKSNCDDSCLANNIYIVCSLPMDPGIGNEVKMKYFYDTMTKKCRIFSYMGSMGNLNRFQTYEECTETCVKVMLEVNRHSSQASALIQPLVITSQNLTGGFTNITDLNIDTELEYCYDQISYGICSNFRPLTYVTKYSYNVKGGRCEPHKFWGCGPTSRNSFDSLSLCDEMCTNRISLSMSSICARSTSWCSNSSWIYWRYNPKRGLCELFPSCTKKSSLDESLFTKEELCIQTCVPRPPLKREFFDVCHLKPSILTTTTKNCSSSHKRWFYNESTRNCQSSFSCISYGNNFATNTSCLESCEPDDPRVTCMSPVDKGSCSGNISMFHFDWSSQRCVSFSYSGCLGNKNRFSSLERCQAFCSDNTKISLSHVPNVLLAVLASMIALVHRQS